MTEDQIRAAVRAEITPFREEVKERFDGIDEKLGIIGQRLDVASKDRQEMMRLLKTLAPKPAGGRSPAPLKVAAKDSN